MVLLASAIAASAARAAPPPTGGSTVIAGTPNATGVVSLIATDTSGPGYLQVLPCGTTPGAYSNLNVNGAGQTIATLAFVRFDTSGRACVYDQTSTNVVADLQGYMNTGAFDDITDVRLVDTRTTARSKVAITRVLTGFEYRGSDAFPLASAFVSVPPVPLTFTATDRSNNGGTPVCSVDGNGGLVVAPSVPSVPFTCGISATAAATATTETATATYDFVVQRISVSAHVIGTPTKTNNGNGTYRVQFVMAFTPPRPGSVLSDASPGTCGSVSFDGAYDAVAGQFAIDTVVNVPSGGCKVIVVNNLNDQFTGAASVTVDVP